MAEGDAVVIVGLIFYVMRDLVVKTLILLLECPVLCDRMFKMSV